MTDHRMDGSDPDNVAARPGARGQAELLVADYAELEGMSEADKRHYCAAPGGSRRNSISRGK